MVLGVVLVLWTLVAGADVPDGPSRRRTTLGHRRGRRRRRGADPRRRRARGRGVALRQRPGGLRASTCSRTTRAPRAPTCEAADPWGGRDRVNVLLLGGDGGPYREGVRTDSMILVSIDTHTGRAVSFSLPRNMMNAPFPEDSPLHDVFPERLHRRRATRRSWMLNAVYREVPILYPHILGKSTNEGADAIKQAFEGATGLPVDYYVLINFQGFQQMVDAIGGVTVNINEPVAVERRHRRRHPADPLPPARPRPAPRRLRRAVVRPRPLRLRRLPADGPAALHDPGDRREGEPAEPPAQLPGRGEGRARSWSGPTSRARCCRRSSTWA